MTDITGNFGINAYNHNDRSHKNGGKSAESSRCSDCDDLKEFETDLGKHPCAIDGQLLVNRTQKTDNIDGEYKFDPKKIEEDVIQFQLLADFAQSLKGSYMEKGFTEEQADLKVDAAIRCLINNS